MLRLKNLEIGKLSTFLDLTHQNQETFPIELHKFRNGILGEMWIKSIHDWNIKDKVIDVGCGYATLPGYLAERVSEVWGADDFGINSDDKYWERGKSPKEISKKYPKVKYVFERLGKNTSNFPSNYFDVVLSNQALHVAPFPHKAIWEDMFRVMNKQYKSCIIISMICNFCSDGEPRNALKRLKEIDELESNLIEKWENMVDISMREFDDIQNKYNNSLHRLSPALYTMYVSTILGVERFPVPEELRAKNFCTDVNSLIEPASNGFGNAQFSGEQNEANQYKYGRYAPLLIKFEWQGIKDPVYIGNESKKDLIKYMLNADIGGTSEALNHDKYADIYSFKEDESYSTHTTSFLVETKNREGFDLELLVKGNGRNNFDYG